MSACVLVMTLRPAKIAEAIEMPFGLLGGQGTTYYIRCESLRRSCNIYSEGRAS